MIITNNQNKLVNRALKSDVKLTVIKACSEFLNKDRLHCTDLHGFTTAKTVTFSTRYVRTELNNYASINYQKLTASDRYINSLGAIPVVTHQRKSTPFLNYCNLLTVFVGNFSIKVNIDEIKETQAKMKADQVLVIQQLERMTNLLVQLLQGAYLNNNGAQAADASFPVNSQDIIILGG